MIKQSIDSDLKKFMLSGDKDSVTVLRTLKSAILDREISENKRDSGLSDDEVIALLQKEYKKRQEAVSIYEQAGDSERSQKEQAEADFIKKYLPEMMSEDELRQIIDEVVDSYESPSMRDMGSIINEVKQKVGARADGAMIAKLVKESISGSQSR